MYIRHHPVPGPIFATIQSPSRHGMTPKTAAFPAQAIHWHKDQIEQKETVMPQPKPTPKQAPKPPKPQSTPKKDPPVIFKDWASI